MSANTENLIAFLATLDRDQLVRYSLKINEVAEAMQAKYLAMRHAAMSRDIEEAKQLDHENQAGRYLVSFEEDIDFMKWVEKNLWQ